MTPEKKKERIDYLWKKVRISVFNQFLWNTVRKDIIRKRAGGFDLDERDSILVDTEDEVEFSHKYPTAQVNQSTNLSWYIIPVGSILSTTQHIMIETLTLCQMFITPLVLAFDDARDMMIIPQLVFDSIWCVGIIMSFVAADKVNTTFK